MSSGSGTIFPKWQIALLLGATGAIGLTYWYMKHYTMRQNKKGTLLELKKKGSRSIDESETKTSTPKTKLELAVQHKIDGNDFFKKGAYDKAIACYTKAIDECPIENGNELATFYQNRAACYEHLKKHSAIIDDCTKALEFKRNYLKAYLRRARAYEAIKNWNDCLDDISAVCLLEGFNDQGALIMADRVLKELGKAHAHEAITKRIPITPSSYFIHTYFSSFAEDPVYNFILNSENKSGDDENSRGFLRAAKAFQAKKFDEIIPACTEEIDSSESDAQYKMEALLLRGTLHLLRGSHDDAFADLEAVISNEQNDVKLRVSALIKRASLHMQLEQTEECLADFNRAAELGPTIADVFHHRGQVNLIMERAEQATEDFNRAVTLNPDFPIAFVQKCYSDYRQACNAKDIRAVEECMNRFKRATERFPKCTECYVLYAQVLCDEKQYAKADEYYNKAMEIDQSNATILVHKGLLILQWQSDVETGVRLIAEAIEKDPLCEFAFETLATIEVQRGNLPKSIELFDKAITLAKTELEMTHLFSLRDAALSQLKIAERLNIPIAPPAMS